MRRDALRPRLSQEDQSAVAECEEDTPNLLLLAQDLLRFSFVVVVACLPLSSILQQTLVFLARDLSSVSPPLVPVSDLL